MQNKLVSAAALMSAAVLLTSIGMGSTAYAGGSVSATFNTVTSSNPDVGGAITGVVTGLVQNTLGPDGLPVSSGLQAFQDVNGAGELQWWTPHATWVTAGSSNYADGPYSLPFNITSGFFANGSSNGVDQNTGHDNGFISTHLQATFAAPAGGSVTFDLGSDDDSWVFLNGKLVVDNGGVHALATAPTLVTGLLVGTNTVDVFQVDRHIVESGLYFNADVQLNAVPEPSTWAMMGLGFAGLAFAGYRTSKRRAAASA